MYKYKLYRVLSTDGLDKNGIRILKEYGIEVVEHQYSKADLKKELVNFDAIIIRSATSIDEEIIRAVTANETCKLKVIARAGTGVDNIDVETATEKGLLVINTPAANTLSAAEHTCALMCCLSRQIPQAYMSMQQGKWDRKTFMGTELMDKTIGIIGFGRIGREVALRSQAFGMRTVAYDPMVDRQEAKQLKVEVMELRDLLATSDYVTVHVPLIKQTANLINSQSLELCKDGVKVINCSRGGIINEDDLLTALKNGKCGGAALDVFLEEPPNCTELIKHPKLISTPHLGASTKEAQYRVSMEIADNLLQISKGETLSGLVNGSSLRVSLQPEVKNWKTLLKKISSAAVDLSEVQLFYSNDITFCSKRDFEDFIKNYLALEIYGLKKNVTQKINLINSNIYAKLHNLVITLEKTYKKKPSEVPQLTMNIHNHLVELMMLNNRLFLVGFDDIFFEQPVLLEGPGQLLVTSDSKEAERILSDLTSTNNLLSYSSQGDRKLSVFIAKEPTKKSWDNLLLKTNF